MINFNRKFLSHAISYQKELQQLINGNKRNDRTPLNWNPAAEVAFQRCKDELSNATLLAHPAADADLAIYVDASDMAVGAALHQEIDGHLHTLSVLLEEATEYATKVFYA